MVLKKRTPGAGLPPPRGNIHVYYHSIQNFFFSETVWLIKAKHLVFLGRENEGYINGHGHMTKMSAMAINSKNH